jgi:hypothetical protein
VLLHVLFRQLYAYGKDTNGKNHSGYLERDLVDRFFIAMGPFPRIKNVTTVWADDHSKKKGPYGFTYIKLSGTLYISEDLVGQSSHRPFHE